MKKYCNCCKKQKTEKLHYSVNAGKFVCLPCLMDLDKKYTFLKNKKVK